VNLHKQPQRRNTDKSLKVQVAAGLSPGHGTHLHILLDRGLEPEPTGKKQFKITRKIKSGVSWENYNCLQNSRSHYLG
jgi:hypothetical protein